MCSLFMPRMENYQGDLTDIVRASGGAYGCVTGASEPSPDWQFPSDPINFSSAVQEPRDNFGDPFSYMRDPLLNELHVSGSGFFSSTSSPEIMGNTAVEDTGRGFNGGGGGVVGGGGGGASSSASTSTILSQKNFLDDEIKRPCNIFSRMLQISPNGKPPVSPCGSPVMSASPRGIKASAMVPSDMINANSSKGCFIDNTGVQISSPRNPGIKRRKSQAKKVVCIPAPAAVNSRPTGEVVPSDLWAWRKYGQKPIKGSPYPRGYYRCSSSKGCSARKQVERSRTDPNMLVITYTSEHNHPWPTQRNALAGSTRSQPTKNNATSKNFPGSRPQIKPTSPKEEQKESRNEDQVSPIVAGSSTSASVKEEIDDVEKQMEMDDGEFSTEGFPYRPTLPGSNQPEDFFADLGEIETDPLDLLFTQEFTGDAQKYSKVMDPFSLFDWSADKSNSTNVSSFEETKRGL